MIDEHDGPYYWVYCLEARALRRFEIRFDSRIGHRFDIRFELVNRFEAIFESACLVLENLMRLTNRWLMMLLDT